MKGQQMPLFTLFVILFFSASACGEFGLPTGRDDGNIQRGDPTLLDVSPKVLAQGMTADYHVYGIDTYFDDSTTILFPSLGEVDVLRVNATSYELLTLSLSVPEDAPLESSDLEILSDRDGLLTFEDALTIVR